MKVESTNDQIKHETPTCGKRVLPAVFFLGIKVVRYRIVKDNYNGFECQKWRLWFPFWCQMGFTNTHPTLERAIMYIENDGFVVLSS
jgi:hypothetical protein